MVVAGEVFAHLGQARRAIIGTIVAEDQKEGYGNMARLKRNRILVCFFSVRDSSRGKLAIRGFRVPGTLPLIEALRIPSPGACFSPLEVLNQ